MIKKHIILKLNEYEKIIISIPCDSKDLFRYDEIIIKLHTLKKKIIIFAKDFAIVAFRILKYQLTNALEGKLLLHNSIKNDIGYLWMKDLYGKSQKLVYEYNKEGQKIWVGQKYIFWSTPVGGAESWLYEKNGEITLEITPTYRWPESNEKKSGKYPTYRDFLKNYKPLVTTTISKETARRWLNKAEKILKIIEDNDSKYFINPSS